MNLFLGILAIIGFFLFSLLQLYAGYVGIDYYLGSIWAAIALVLALIFRFTLPITIGAFFGVIYVWHWHWLLVILFIAPGLAFILPGVLLFTISKIIGFTRGKNRKQNPHEVIIDSKLE